MGFAPSESN